jgi:hypothetical protein
MRDIAQRLRRGGDAGAGVRVDVAMAVERARHRRDRHIGTASDIADRGSGHVVPFVAADGTGDRDYAISPVAV